MASIKGIELIRKRLIEMKAVPNATLRAAAGRIKSQLTADATTRRGNVPSYGRMGEVPIATEVRADSIAVKGPDWVLKKAQENGQVDGWENIMREEAAAAARRGGT